MHTFFKSFGYALTGIKWALRERNIRIHVVITFFVVISGAYFQLETVEWAALFLAIGLVLSLELMNSAVEEVVTLMTDRHPQLYARAGLPKDMAAGAVLIAAVIAAAVGVVIFTPHVFNILVQLQK